MNLEDRLSAAAAELNQDARRSAPPPFGSVDTIRPWLAFAAAFAVVLAVVGIPLILSNPGQTTPPGGPLGTSEPTSTVCVLADVTTTVVGEIDIHVIAFLNDEGTEGVAEGAHLELLDEVASWDEVASATYYDRDAVWNEYQEIFQGQDDLLEIDPAILPASIRVELVDVGSQGSVKARLEEHKPVVRGVVESPPSSPTALAEVVDCVDETTTTAVDSATTSPTFPTTTGDDYVCAASEYGPPTTIAFADGGDPRDLSDAAKDQLTAIAEAARLCDYNAMATYASEDFITSFGGGGVENIALWYDEGEDPYSLILELLNMVHGVQEMPDGERLFVWPAAFAYDSWDEIPQEFVTPLLAIYTQEELDQIATFGSYAGWRIGITESGEWLFFVAGD